MSREAFEHWALYKMYWPIDRHPTQRHYVYSRTNDAWLGYELAMKSIT